MAIEAIIKHRSVVINRKGEPRLYLRANLLLSGYRCFSFDKQQDGVQSLFVFCYYITYYMGIMVQLT